MKRTPEVRIRDKIFTFLKKYILRHILTFLSMIMLVGLVITYRDDYRMICQHRYLMQKFGPHDDVLADFELEDYLRNVIKQTIH